MRNRTLLATLILFVFAFFSHATIFAATPSKTLGFQGQLFNNSTPLTGSVSATFTFYDAASGGNTTGSTISKTVTVNNGYFGTQFSEADLTGVNFDQALYVQVAINGTSLSPRTALNSAPSALKAFGAFSYSSAPTVGAAGSLYFNSTDNTLYISNGTTWNAASSLWTKTGNDITYIAGNVGIGTTTPTDRLTVDVGVPTGATRSQQIGFNQYNPTILPIDFLSGGAKISLSQPNSGSVDSTFIAAYRTPGGTNNMAIAARNDIVFSINTGSAFNEALRISNNGRIGIGTSTPPSPLTISGDNFTMLHIKRESSVFTSAGTGVKLENMGDASTTSSWTIQAASGAMGIGNGGGRFSIGYNYTTAGPQEQFVISPYGNVGINTQFNNSQGYFPAAKLTVMASSTSSSTDSQIRLLSNRVAIIANDLIGGIDFASHDTQIATAGIPTAAIKAIANTTHTTTALGTDLSFNVTNTLGMSEAIRILGNGNVGIGTSTPTATLHASGTIRFSSLGAGTLSTDALGNVTVSSDERLKNIQGAFTIGLEKVLALSPILYTWKTETGYDTEHTYAGFNAQNVQSAIPEAVSTDTRGFLTLSDRPILAVLVNAVKELAAKVDGFATKITTKEVKSDTLCLGNTCVTEEQLKILLLNSGQIPNTTLPSVTLPAESPATSTSTSTEIVAETSSTTEPAAPIAEPVVDVQTNPGTTTPAVL